MNGIPWFFARLFFGVFALVVLAALPSRYEREQYRLLISIDRKLSQTGAIGAVDRPAPSETNQHSQASGQKARVSRRRMGGLGEILDMENPDIDNLEEYLNLVSDCAV